MLLRYAFLLFGVFSCSTSVIFIKWSETNAALLASYRLLLAAALLSPFYLRDAARHRAAYTRRDLLRSLLPGVLLGVHLLTWNIGARATIAANATLVINLTPIAMPFMLYFFARERLTRMEWIGSSLGVFGVLLLSVSDIEVGSGHVFGDLVCFGSMVIFAAYLALGRKNRTMPSIWLYVVPLYLIAGVTCLLIALPFENPIQRYPLRELGCFAGLAILPTIIGHSILNHSLKHLRGQAVALFNTTQFIYAGIMAFFFFRELPQAMFFVSSVFLITGIALVIREKAPRDRAMQEAAARMPASD